MAEPANAGTQSGAAAAPPAVGAQNPHVARAIARYGSAENALGVVLRENKRFRDASKDAKGAKLEMDRDLEQENADLLRENARLTALAPAQGSVVLTAEQAKDWEAYQALGKVTEVKDKVGRLDKAEADLALVSAKTIHAEAATALGWNDEALTTFATKEGLHIEMKDGKPVARKASDEKAALEPLNEVVDKQFKLYVPMLKAPKEVPAGTTRTSSTGGSTQPRTQFPRMGGSASSSGAANAGTGNSVLDAHRARQQQLRAGAVNPLRTAAPAATDAK
jgi:hypothetical protein